MTTKLETKFGNEIRKNINAFWQPFTITATAGVPDLYGIRDGVSVWLELKCINKNSINISPLQISWNYTVKGHQTVQREQRTGTQGTGFQMSMQHGT